MLYLFVSFSFNLWIAVFNKTRRPVFDANLDTYEALHERSPFAVDSICMVAARVRDGGGMDNFLRKLGTLNIIVSGKSSELYLKCLEEVQAISSATLFAPVVRSETVQSMSSSFFECIRSAIQSLFYLS